MSQMDQAPSPAASLEDIQRGWHELTLKVEQAAAECSALEAENKALRFLVERLIEHRLKSHGDLVNFMADLVSRLPLNDTGLLVSRLVEHNLHNAEICAVLLKGKVEAGDALQPAALKQLDEKRRGLKEAVKPLIEELLKLDAPLEPTLLEALREQPESFFSPLVVRANRCFVKGHLPRERVVREFGEEALPLFNDLTTDPRFNPRPKPDEIVLGFKEEFPALLAADTTLAPAKKAALQALFHQVQRSKGFSKQARTQRQVFAKLSFLLELLRYYDNQTTEAPDAVFAQRLPAAVEQLAVRDTETPIESQTIAAVESLLFYIIKPEHRHMVINNLGKAGGDARTLRCVLALREEKVDDLEHALGEFVRHLIPTPPEPLPAVAAMTHIISLIPPSRQRLLVGSLMSTDRRLRSELTELGLAIAAKLGLKDLEEARRLSAEVPPEMERRMAWDEVRALIQQRADAGAIAGAIRHRLHSHYDVDEVKESWLALTEADAVTFIRVLCQLPYLEDGRTDAIAHTVMQIYVGRLLHEKYAATYAKVLTSLKTMRKANPNSPTLANFLAMVKWADPEAANKVSADLGIT